jgi:hypothetical protein
MLLQVLCQLGNPMTSSAIELVASLLVTQSLNKVRYHHHNDCLAGAEPSPLLLRPFIGELYHPWMIDGDDCGVISEMNEWQGKPKYWEETCPSAALSTTDLHDLT